MERVLASGERDGRVVLLHLVVAVVGLVVRKAQGFVHLVAAEPHPKVVDAGLRAGKQAAELKGEWCCTCMSAARDAE